jgi:hypothetical protein
MKKVILMGAAALLLAATTAVADSWGGDGPIFFYPTWSTNQYQAVAKVELEWPSGGCNGGPFTVNVLGGSLTEKTGFMTFCVESSIDFYPGTPYYATIDPYAAAGWSTNTGTITNPLSPGAAYIYEQYRANKLTGYSNTDISRAIWHEMGTDVSIVNNYDSYGYYVDPVGYNALVAAADTYASSGGGIGNVRVLNLWSLTATGTHLDQGETVTTWIATDAQSQLILDPSAPPSAIVPAPAAISLGMIGLAALGVYMRRYA